MLSHSRGLTASPRARYTLKWEMQIPMNSGRSIEHHHEPRLSRTNKPAAVEQLYSVLSRSRLAAK
jgi:hypothetical protein